MFSFENLEVYKKAFLVNQEIYRFLKIRKNIPPYARNQLGRATLSILLNIAEGSAKFSGRDKRNFYVTARGSAYECSSLVQFLCEEGEIPQEMKEKLISVNEEISKMLFTMIKGLEKAG